MPPGIFEQILSAAAAAQGGGAGATGAPGAGGGAFDPAALQGLGVDPTQQMLDLLAVLSKLSPPTGGSAALLPEQRARAQMQAQSYPSGAKYIPGYEPNGLWDAMSNSMQFTAPMPQIAPEARMIDRVPLDSSLGGMSREAAAADAAGPQNPYQGAIEQLIASIMGKVMPKPEAMAPTGKITPPSLPGAGLAETQGLPRVGRAPQGGQAAAGGPSGRAAAAAGGAGSSPMQAVRNLGPEPSIMPFLESLFKNVPLRYPVSTPRMGVQGYH